MDRSELLSQVSEASSLNQISSVMAAAARGSPTTPRTTRSRRHLAAVEDGARPLHLHPVGTLARMRADPGSMSCGPPACACAAPSPGTPSRSRPTEATRGPRPPGLGPHRPDHIRTEIEEMLTRARRGRRWSVHGRDPRGRPPVGDVGSASTPTSRRDPGRLHDGPAAQNNGTQPRPSGRSSTTRSHVGRRARARYAKRATSPRSASRPGWDSLSCSASTNARTSRPGTSCGWSAAVHRTSVSGMAEALRRA